MKEVKEFKPVRLGRGNYHAFIKKGASGYFSNDYGKLIRMVEKNKKPVYGTLQEVDLKSNTPYLLEGGDWYEFFYLVELAKKE